ncbi:MAG: hypothetical protein WBM04_02095 [Candidatus Korobacteraceae bacterium]
MSVVAEESRLAKGEEQTAKSGNSGFFYELRPLFRLRWLQMTVLAGLLVAVGVIAFNLKFSVLDLDIWWHLKVGDWIVQHKAVPHTGLFSWTAADRPWTAYSWGYEVLMSRAYAWFGLLGIGIYGTLLTLGVAYFIYWMLRRLSGRFWTACILAVVTCSAFLFNLMPRPVFFSMMLFCVTLTLVLEAHRTGRAQLLYWLPLIFLLWANLHIQFIYGLFLVGLLLPVNVAQSVGARIGFSPTWLLEPKLPATTLAAVFAACVIATCIGPNSYHLYQVIFQYSQAKVPYRMIMELQPLSFRAGSHYVELLLMAFAFFAVGRQRKVDIFKVLLLAIAGAVAFRTMRDAWFICIPAAACIADTVADDSKREPNETWLQKLAVAAVVGLALLLFAPSADFNTRGLDRAISSFLPVNAVNYLRQHPARGPLYNTLDWGGFLTWYMPNYPVAIDGRTDLYGDDLEELFFETANGAPTYADNPYLNQAGVVILQKSNNLVSILQADPRFQLVYQDALAAVFVRSASP